MFQVPSGHSAGLVWITDDLIIKTWMLQRSKASYNARLARLKRPKKPRRKVTNSSTPPVTKDGNTTPAPSLPTHE